MQRPADDNRFSDPTQSDSELDVSSDTIPPFGGGQGTRSLNAADNSPLYDDEDPAEDDLDDNLDDDLDDEEDEDVGDALALDGEILSSDRGIDPLDEIDDDEDEDAIDSSGSSGVFPRGTPI